MLDARYFSRYFRISAHDRNKALSGQSNSNFTVNVPSNSSEFQNVVACQIVSAEIPNVFYNIPEGKNTFIFATVATPGTDITVTVTSGQYTLDELVATLTSQISTSLGGGSVTSSTNTNTKRITINFPEAISFTASRLENPLSTTLGFEDGVIYDGSSIESTYPPNLAGPGTVYVHSRQISPGVTDFDRSEDIHSILGVPLDLGFGFTCHWQARDSVTNLFRYINPRNLNEISLALRDRYGMILDINGHDWSVVIKMYYKNQ